MKSLFIGGIKSGKPASAEKRALELKKNKNLYYLATSEAIDDEMREKISMHKQKRNKELQTIEEPLAIYEKLKNINGVVLLECVSMWINNMIYYKKSDEEILCELERVLDLPLDIIFVMNDVGSSVVSKNAVVRRFVNINGVVAQKIASKCDEVLHCLAGISLKIK